MDDDGFVLICGCSQWIGGGADAAGRPCPYCRASRCLPDHDLHQAQGRTCQRCRRRAARRRPDELPQPTQVGELRRHRMNYRDRPTVFVPAAASVADQLSQLGGSVERAYLCGPIEQPAAWASGELPAGWDHAPAGHYLDSSYPVLRFVRAGRTVELHRAGAMFGDDPAAAVEHYEAAWSELGRLISDAFDEGRVLSTASTTGRYLLLRSIPFDRAWPVLDPDTRELIRTTSGQGRVELLPGPAELPELVELDARLAYGAVCWGLGAGVPVRDRVPEYAGQQRGRYSVSFTVPAGWELPGVLGVHDGTGWRWPSAPGETGQTWCDGAELGIALAHGWSVRIRERLLFPPYSGPGPLDGWAKKLAAIRGAVVANPERHGGLITARLVAAGVRSILLHGIGSLHGSPHRITRAATSERAVPAGAEGWRVEGDTHVWTETTDGAAWADFAHPEWSAAIWSRARARLLDAPTAEPGQRAGMLHLRPGSVIAARTDALYVDHVPGWPDDGKPGRYRVVWRTGACRRPGSHAELLAAKGGGDRG